MPMHTEHGPHFTGVLGNAGRNGSDLPVRRVMNLQFGIREVDAVPVGGMKTKRDISAKAIVEVLRFDPSA